MLIDSPRSAGGAAFLHHFDGKIVYNKSDTEGHWFIVNIEVDDLITAPKKP